MSLREELIQVAAVAIAIVQDLDYGDTYVAGGLTSDRLKTRMGFIANEVMDERLRQEDKWGPQHHTPAEWLAILAEEVGEAANEVRRPVVNTADFGPLFKLLVHLSMAESNAREFLKVRFG